MLVCSVWMASNSNPDTSRNTTIKPVPETTETRSVLVEERRPSKSCLCSSGTWASEPVKAVWYLGQRAGEGGLDRLVIERRDLVAHHLNGLQGRR